MNASLEIIWHEFSGKLGQFIRARVADPATAEDLLQDVFVKVHQKLGQLNDSTKLPSWIYLITRNVIIDHYRTRKETVGLPENLLAETETDTAEHEALTSAFRHMIHSLEEPYRQALILTEFEGLTQAQLAEREGISLSGAKSRVQRGRQQLKQMLTDCCTFEFDRRGRVIDCNPKQQAGCPECA